MGCLNSSHCTHLAASPSVRPRCISRLGRLLAAHVTPANAQERVQVAQRCEEVQEATGETVKLAWANQGHTEEEPNRLASEHGIASKSVTRPGRRDEFITRSSVICPYATDRGF